LSKDGWHEKSEFERRVRRPRALTNDAKSLINIGI